MPRPARAARPGGGGELLPPPREDPSRPPFGLQHRARNAPPRPRPTERGGEAGAARCGAGPGALRGRAGCEGPRQGRPQRRAGRRGAARGGGGRGRCCAHLLTGPGVRRHFGARLQAAGEGARAAAVAGRPGRSAPFNTEMEPEPPLGSPHLGANAHSASSCGRAGTAEGDGTDPRYLWGLFAHNPGRLCCPVLFLKLHFCVGLWVVLKHKSHVYICYLQIKVTSVFPLTNVHRVRCWCVTRP